MTKILKNALMRGLCAIVATTLLAGAAQPVSWNIPTPYPAGSFHTRNVVQFAEEITEATGGALTITVHPAGSLVKHPEIKNAVRSRQVQAGEFLLSRLSNENPLFEADAIPFLAASYEDAWRLWQAQKALVQDLLGRQNLTVLYAVPWPPQGLYTSQAVYSIEDFAGMRFRTYNAATERLAQIAGAVPTQVEVPDIAQAFATGRVEGMITSSTTGVNTKAWDYLSHYYDARAFLPKNVVVVNTTVLAELPEDQRRAVLDAAARAEERGWEMSRRETDIQTRTLAENGIIVARPPEALAAALEGIGEQMANEWAERAGPVGRELVDGLRTRSTAAAMVESDQ